MHPFEAPLPPDALAALERITTLHNLDGNEINLPDFMCTSTLDISITSFIVSNDHQKSEAEKPPLHPTTATISEKITSLGLSSLAHLHAQDTVVYLDKERVPFLERKEEYSEETEKNKRKMKKTLLTPRQVSSLGWHLYSQLPPPSSAPGNVRVLVLVTPPSILPLEIETSSSSYSKTSYRVAENLLLVLVPAVGAAGTQEEEGRGYNEVAAQEVRNWLSAYTSKDKYDAKSNANISQQCMQRAAKEISKFLKILNRASETGIKITAEVARAAGTAVTSYNLAEESFVRNPHGSLQQSRIAWSTARALASHVDLGATPQLPSEHVLALLLPIGLPIFLAIVQAVGREVKEAKKLVLLRKEEEESKDKEA